MFIESEEQPARNEYYTPKIAKLRNICANKIWIEWSNDRHFGPRVGVILISTMEKGAEKVCFFRETIKINKNLYFFRFY